MRRSQLAVAVVILSVASSAGAADGVLVVEKTTSATGTRTTQVQLEKNRMRAETASRGADVVIFDGTAQVLRILDTDGKSYREMTKADVDSMGDQLGQMMAMMREQLAKMPPEQRAQVEAMMQGRGGGPGMGAMSAPQIEYRKAGSDTVGKWACEKYEGYREGRKVAELCTVSPQALGFTPADFAVSEQLTEFFSKLAPQIGDQVFRVGKAGPQGFSGVPVRRITFGADGTPSTTAEIAEVSRQRFPDSLFALPSDFQKTEMPMMGGPGRGVGRGRGRGRE
jgi:hypothetical protein